VTTRPGRILIASWAGGGNTPAAFNLGTRLVRRGHRVRVLGWHSMAREAADADVEFLPYRSMSPWPEDLSLDDGWEMVKEFLRSTDIRDDIVAEAIGFEADALVVDCMMGAAFAARAQLGLPTAVLTHLLYSEYAAGWGDERLEGSMDELFGATDRVGSTTRSACRRTPPTSDRLRTPTPAGDPRDFARTALACSRCRAILGSCSA